jgi:hypothetical protein
MIESVAAKTALRLFAVSSATAAFQQGSTLLFCLLEKELPTAFTIETSLTHGQKKFTGLSCWVVEKGVQKYHWAITMHFAGLSCWVVEKECKNIFHDYTKLKGALFQVLLLTLPTIP